MNDRQTGVGAGTGARTAGPTAAGAAAQDKEQEAMRFEGRVALVTGAGSGIGRASATLFAQEGAAVGVLDRQEAAARETVSQITDAGGRAVALVADVSREAEVAERPWRR